MTADSHLPYRVPREVVGARRTSRAWAAGVSPAASDCGSPRWPRAVDGRIRTVGHKVMRRDQSRVR